ncbi:unnamed protein product [Clonostachys rhizophaga]|uniref:ceramidase n=1 Tax=Clonostachys rhizophaga TaxID=160324 RepID=A0A9N9VFH3_9HYPO|nr:unnamed protein product [Clonostachys rhizophaga]
MSLAGGPIPTYRVDIALPPEERYVEIARDFAPRMRDMTTVFNDLLDSIFRYPIVCWLVKTCAKLFLCRLHDDEQDREVKSVAKLVGMENYLLIALNILLDVMMGCTAGCILTEPNSQRPTEATSCLMHFRTLDWAMDPLRHLLIVVEFVDSRDDPHRVIATSITYAGFLGTLTATRPGLSVSLNYRPSNEHSCSSIAVRKHQLLVLFGFRPSVASVLRSVILREGGWALHETSASDSASSPIITLATQLTKQPTSPCYLTLSDGVNAAVIEKDVYGGKLKTSDRFIVQTNHDTHKSGCCSGRRIMPSHPDDARASLLGAEPWLKDSNLRMTMLHEKWLLHAAGAETVSPVGIEKKDENGLCFGQRADVSSVRPRVGVKEHLLQEWMMEFPIINECSHYGCIMDPRMGDIRWLVRGMIEYDPKNPRF